MNKKYSIISAAIVILIALDQITKHLFQNALLITRTPFLQSKEIKVIDNFFQFRLSYNDGGAWGILSGNMIIFYIITIFAFGLFYLLIKDTDLKHKKFYTIAVTLLIAGAIGNFIDRLLFQEVIDFIDFIIFGYDFPIFNFADIFLVVGVIMFGADVLLEDILNGKHKSNKGS
jgi:signal peptidase II